MGVTGIRRLFVVVVLGASVGLNMFTSAIVNLALPTLAADLNADTGKGDRTGGDTNRIGRGGSSEIPSPLVR